MWLRGHTGRGSYDGKQQKEKVESVSRANASSPKKKCCVTREACRNISPSWKKRRKSVWKICMLLFHNAWVGRGSCFKTSSRIIKVTCPVPYLAISHIAQLNFLTSNKKSVMCETAKRHVCALLTPSQYLTQQCVIASHRFYCFVLRLPAQTSLSSHQMWKFAS